MVNREGTVDNLVLAIIVNVIYTEAVVTLCLVLRTCLVCIECPVNIKLSFIVYIVSCKTCSCVVSSRKYCIWLLTIKISCCRQESVNTVTICIAPCTNISSCRNEVRCAKNASVLTVEHCEVLRSVKNIS